MNQSFSRSVIFIYVTRIIGFITGFFSVFLVVPSLASRPEVFGIYTACISLTIFFSYSDLGFISAGQKYAAEFFAQKNLKKEMEVIGFVLYILFIFLLFCSIGIGIIALMPEFLIKDLSAENRTTSKELLMILCFSSPIIIFQRLNAIIYSVRLNDYIYQSIDIVANLIKIVGVTWFVTKDNYDIVGYYLFIQILSFTAALISTVIATKVYKFKFGELFRNIKYSKDMFTKTKSLAFSSLLLTISWIFYFELDSILLSKIYGVKVVAFYAIGFTILSFCRNIYNTLYAPFQARFNHFVGIADEDNLIDMLEKVIRFTFILCIVPPIVLIFYMRSIIQVWVGSQYLTSVMISNLFVLTIAFSAVSIPLSYILIAKSKNYILRLSAIILPVIFYSCFLVFHFLVGEKSLAIAKVLTIFIGACITIWGVYSTIIPNLFSIYWDILKKMILPIGILIVHLYLFPAPLDLRFRNVSSFVELSYYMVPAVFIPLIIYYYILLKPKFPYAFTEKNWYKNS